VYKEGPLRFEHLDSEPEPDATVCANPDLESFGTETMRPLLVIEVSESSLARDPGDKLMLYAKARIREYWWRRSGLGCEPRRWNARSLPRSRWRTLPPAPHTAEDGARVPGGLVGSGARGFIAVSTRIARSRARRPTPARRDRTPGGRSDRAYRRRRRR
jgi:hypothetical protein